MQSTESNNQIYRHKKFDFGRSADKADLLLKEELISRTGTPYSSRSRSTYDEWEEDSTSLCSSEYGSTFLPLAKRRRLDSSTTAAASTSSSASSSHSLTSISAAALQNICKYHGNMVRKFPKKERTPKDQERRNKNTIACRMSRRVKKLEHLAIEEQYNEFSSQHLKIAEQSMRACVYLNHLQQLVRQEAKEAKSPAAPKPQNSPMPAKNFSIEYLIGAMQREQCSYPESTSSLITV
ncbi:protein Mabiki [Drosophila miranda]|uniref:protein Mabiki n=1 Tax=Drosophila miranda TaxID=7229 RepID=UPI0007E80D98|nr:protein Mabiki [Drosophila miranda]